MKQKYEIRQIDAMCDVCWYWNTSYHIGEFKTASQNVNQPFMKSLRKLGITFDKGTVYVANDGDICEVRNRKTDEPYFAAIPIW